MSKETDQEKKISNDADIQLIVGENYQPHIPEGIYQATYVKHEKEFYFGNVKLYVWLRICELGVHNGVELYRAYNFANPLRPGMDLYKDILRLEGKRIPKNSKFSLALFKNKVIEVQVRTVKQDRKQTPLPEHMQYSTIDKILRIAAGHSIGGSK